MTIISYGSYVSKHRHVNLIFNMNINLRQIALATVSAMSVLCAAAATTPSITADKYWENQHMFGENRETGHATYVPYPSVAAMKAPAAWMWKNR